MLLLIDLLIFHVSLALIIFAFSFPRLLDVSFTFLLSLVLRFILMRCSWNRSCRY